MSRDINPFGLRMPPELRESIEAAATASGRSLNAEIVFRLQQTLTIEGLLDSDDTIESVFAEMSAAKRQLDDNNRRLKQLEERLAGPRDLGLWIETMTQKVDQIEREHAARVAAKKK